MSGLAQGAPAQALRRLRRWSWHIALLALLCVASALLSLVCFLRPPGSSSLPLPEAIDTGVIKKHAFCAPHVKNNIAPERRPHTIFENIYMPDYPIFVGANGHLPDSYRFRLYSGTINSRGFRGPREFAERKEKGVFRIAVFGTGVTFGEGVNDDNVYCEVLQRLLEQGFPSRKIEVLNLGVPCQTTPKMVSFFLDYHRKLDCDLIIFMAGVNDSLPMFRVSLKEYRDALELLLAELKRENVKVLFPVEPVNTFYPWPVHYRRYVAELMKKLREYRVASLDLPEILDACERADGLRMEERLGFQCLVRYTGGRRQVLHSVFHPAGAGDKYIAQELYQYIDTHKVFMKTFITDVHLNEYGHLLVAQKLYERLKPHLEGP